MNSFLAAMAGSTLTQENGAVNGMDGVKIFIRASFCVKLSLGRMPTVRPNLINQGAPPAMNMKMLNPKVMRDIKPYLFQSALATFTMLIVLMYLNGLFHAAIVASLGSTAFTIFAMPKSRAAGTRPVICGYLIAMGVGLLCYSVSLLPKMIFSQAADRPLFIIFGSLAVGLSIFLMILANSEHPPAAGMALWLVLSSWDRTTITFVMTAILMMALVKYLLKDRLVDLV